jgi:acyl dehydratase
MIMRVRIAELEAFVGKELGVSEWYEVTQERINAFAHATEDDQWIHLDEARSREESPYGTTIAHGYFTLSLAPRLMRGVLEVTDARFLVNPGIERFRLRAPVPCGSRIRMHASLKRMRIMPNGSGHATMSISFEVEGEKKRCAFGDVNLFYLVEEEDVS